MRTTAYHKPIRLEDALALLAADEGARYVAGGTDLLVGSSPRPPTIVSLRSIPELEGIDGAHIGAMTKVADIALDPRLGAAYPVLVEAAGRLGSVQIRNAATIGGNLCRAAPCADLAPPLLVLEAHAEITGPDGTREVPVTSFFEGPGETCLAAGEVLTGVRLPDPRPKATGVFLKKGRVRMDLSIASVCVLLEMDGARCARMRIAAGSVAPTPVRLPEVEALLEGNELTPALLTEAGALASRLVEPITDIRSTALYRRRIVDVYVRRGITQAIERGVQS